MSTDTCMEIELKFLIAPAEFERFNALMATSSFAIEPRPTLDLTNAYYDTADNVLRTWDFGLRTRTSLFESGEGWSEQTVKLAGQDVGGLHQRPEHTIKFEHAKCVFAELTKFDPSIWPPGFDPVAIQPKIEKVFETEFKRRIWMVTMPGGTQIECVFDQGQVKAGDSSQVISEVELELVTGQVDEVFHFAQYLTTNLSLKLGSQSKAARGYMLAADTRLKSSNLDALPLTSEHNLEEALVLALSKAVEFIQHNELVLSQNDSPKALRRVLDGVSFLIHILKLYSDLLKGTRAEWFLSQFKSLRKRNEWVNLFYQLRQLTDRQSSYRKDIEGSEYLHDLLSQNEPPEEKIAQAKQQFSQNEYNSLMLNFLQWLTQKGWRTELSLAQIDKLSMPVRTQSGVWLDSAWQKLQPCLIQFKQDTGLNTTEKVYWPLATELLTGLSVGSLYEYSDWQGFRNSLLDLFLGLDEMMLLKTLSNLLAKHEDEEAQKYQSWVQAKQQSLLTALNVSVSHVVKLRPYW